MRYQAPQKLTFHARLFRKQDNPIEQKLWRLLRNRQCGGFKFRRQFPIGKYVLDFYCLEKKLAIELDGSQHLEQEHYDQKRTKFLEHHGIRILRFWDNEVMQNIEGVFETIHNQLKTRTSP